MMRALPLLMIVPVMAGGIALGGERTPPSEATQNLFFNSGFELGDIGYGIKRFLRLKTNPELTYGEPVVDTETFVSGRQSMRIPNPFAEELELLSREVRLRPGAGYTFSAWMKCDVGRLPVLIWLRTNDWRGPIKTFQVGNGWKRHSLSFKADPDKHREYYHLSVWFGRSKDTPPATLWLDDLQLNPGGLRPYHSGSELEVALKTPCLYVSRDGTASARIDCEAINYSDHPVKAGVTLNAMDEYRNAQVASQSFGLSLPPGGRQCFERTVQVGKYGTYRVTPKIDSAVPHSAYPAYFAVVGEYKRRPIDLDNEFCIGVNFAGGPCTDARVKSGLQSWGHSPEKHAELLSLSGCRLVRDWGCADPAFAWRMVEPEEGKWDYRWPDKAVDLYSRHGIRIMPVLGGSDFSYNSAPHSKGGWPKWVRDRSQRRLSLRGYRLKNPLNLPPLELWRTYIRHVGERYKGRISHYEIVNEPNLYLTPEEYRDYLKAASEELRAADPDCKVVGFCVTGDLEGEGKTREFLEPAFADGGLAAAHIVSFHPYDSRQLSSANAADTQIELYRQLLHENEAADKPLWNTELYYLYDGSQGKKYPAHAAATRFLIDLGEGIKQSASVPHSALWSRILVPHADLATHLSVESLPSDVYVAYNALARMFEGAKPITKIRWPLDCMCYVYEKEGNYIAAFWKYGCLQGMSLNLPLSDRNAQLYDLFGNKLSLGQQPLQLGDAPYYLELKQLPGAMSKGAFVASLRKARLESTQKVVIEKLRPQFAPGRDPEGSTGDIVVGKLRPAFSGKGDAVMVGLRNGTPRGIEGELEIRADKDVCLGKIPFQLEPYEEEVAKVPVKFPYRQGRVAIKALARVKDQEWERKFGLDLYAVTEAPGRVEPLRRMGRGWKLKHAVAASFRARHDDRNLYLDVMVEDSTPSGEPAGRDPWGQDCVELFCDSRPGDLTLPLKSAGKYHGQVGRLFIMPYAPKGAQVSTLPRELKGLSAGNIGIETDISPTGYTVKLTIPLEAFGLTPPVKGKGLGFELAVDDGIEQKDVAPIQLTWSSWGSHYKNRLSFGLLKFE